MAKPIYYDVPTEAQEQAKLVKWLELTKVPFYAIPNGGKREPWEAMQLKRTGVQPGVPDLCIPVASGGYHGLYIELKRQKHSKVSANQVEWLTLLKERGYFAEVAYGFEEGRKMVLYYLRLTPTAA